MHSCCWQSQPRGIFAALLPCTSGSSAAEAWHRKGFLHGRLAGFGVEQDTWGQNQRGASVALLIELEARFWLTVRKAALCQDHVQESEFRRIVAVDVLYSIQQTILATVGAASVFTGNAIPGRTFCAPSTVVLFISGSQSATRSPTGVNSPVPFPTLLLTILPTPTLACLIHVSMKHASMKSLTVGSLLNGCQLDCLDFLYRPANLQRLPLHPGRGLAPLPRLDGRRCYLRGSRYG